MNSKNYKLPKIPKLPSLPSSAKTNAAKTTAPRISIPVALAGIKKFSVSSSDKTSLSGLSFGTAPKPRTGSTSSGSQWSSVAQSVKSGGLAGLFDNTGGFGGIGSFISGIANLFGSGKPSPIPVVPYQLPSALAETVSLSVPASSGSAAQVGSTPSVQGSYRGVIGSSLSGPQSHDQIVQAVKQALLTSSSLNDIISEI